MQEAKKAELVIINNLLCGRGLQFGFASLSKVVTTELIVVDLANRKNGIRNTQHGRSLQLIDQGAAQLKVYFPLEWGSAQLQMMMYS